MYSWIPFMAATSLISLVVNAAWVMPLLATDWRFIRDDFFNRLMADSGISVDSNSDGSFNKVLAISQNMLPFPITVTFLAVWRQNSYSMSKSLSKDPLYQLTTLLAGTIPLVVSSCSSPKDLSLRAPWASMTAEYFCRSYSTETDSLACFFEMSYSCCCSFTSPTHTFPKNAARSLFWSKTCLKSLSIFFMAWWSGATPVLMSPYGWGFLSKMSTLQFFTLPKIILDK